MLLITNDVMTRLVLVFSGAFNICVQRGGPRTWERAGCVIHYPDITVDGVMLFAADPIIFLPIFVAFGLTNKSGKSHHTLRRSYMEQCQC